MDEMNHSGLGNGRGNFLPHDIETIRRSVSIEILFSSLLAMNSVILISSKSYKDETKSACSEDGDNRTLLPSGLDHIMLVKGPNGDSSQSPIIRESPLSKPDDVILPRKISNLLPTLSNSLLSSRP